jgi:hypothetical protein
MAASLRVWRILSGPEHEVLPNRERPCTDGIRESVRADVVVDANIAEVSVEAGFHERPHRLGQGLACTLECGDSRFDMRITAGTALALGPARCCNLNVRCCIQQCVPFLHLLKTLDGQMLDGCGVVFLSADYWLRHAQHRIGDSIRFLFESVMRVADGELRLQRPFVEQALKRLVAPDPLKPTQTMKMPWIDGTGTPVSPNARAVGACRYFPCHWRGLALCGKIGA